MDASSTTACGAKLVHEHGVAFCDMHGAHDQHEGWCDSCYEGGLVDVLDRLEWERDGEDWTTAEASPPAPPS